MIVRNQTVCGALTFMNRSHANHLSSYFSIWLPTYLSLLALNKWPRNLAGFPNTAKAVENVCIHKGIAALALDICGCNVNKLCRHSNTTTHLNFVEGHYGINKTNKQDWGEAKAQHTAGMTTNNIHTHVAIKFLLSSLLGSGINCTRARLQGH